MLTIDTHVHVISRDLARYPLEVEIRSEWVRSHPVDAEEMVAQMAHAGVAAAILVQSNSAYKNDNAYTADSAERYDNCAIGVGIVDPLEPAAGETVRYWVSQRGIRGIRLASNGSAGTFAGYHKETFAVWEAAKELNIPLAMPLIAEDAAAFAEALETFPTVKVAIEHSSTARLGAEIWDAVHDLTAHDNLYAKFSNRLIYAAATEGKTLAIAMKPLLAAFGSSRLMWGSDFPAMHDKPYAGIVREAREAVARLPSGDQEQLMGAAARAFWPGLP